MTPTSVCSGKVSFCVLLNQTHFLISITFEKQIRYMRNRCKDGWSDGVSLCKGKVDEHHRHSQQSLRIFVTLLTVIKSLPLGKLSSIIYNIFLNTFPFASQPFCQRICYNLTRFQVIGVEFLNFMLMYLMKSGDRFGVWVRWASSRRRRFLNKQQVCKTQDTKP